MSHGKDSDGMEAVRDRRGSGQFARTRAVATNLIRECGYFTYNQVARVAGVGGGSARMALRPWVRDGRIRVVGMEGAGAFMWTFEEFLPEPFAPLEDADLSCVRSALRDAYPTGIADRLYERVRCGNLYWTKIIDSVDLMERRASAEHTE